MRALARKLERERDEALERGASAERERCAKVADGAHAVTKSSDDWSNGWSAASLQIAQAIRMSGGAKRPEQKESTEDDSTPPAIWQMWANVDANMIAAGFQKGEYGLWLWPKKEGAQ